MIHNTCPCCEISVLPHLEECTFHADAPKEAADFDEVLGLRAEISRLEMTRDERDAVLFCIQCCEKDVRSDIVGKARSVISRYE